MFRMLSRLPSFLPRQRCPGPAPTRPVPAALVEPDAPVDDRPPGCGWFDSTYELSHGLLVCEHGDDTAAGALATLALSDWLDCQLHGWQPPAPAAQA